MQRFLTSSEMCLIKLYYTYILYILHNLYYINYKLYILYIYKYVYILGIILFTIFEK